MSSEVKRKTQQALLQNSIDNTADIITRNLARQVEGRRRHRDTLTASF